MKRMCSAIRRSAHSTLPTQTIVFGMLALSLLSVGATDSVQAQQKPHMVPDYRQASLYSPDYVRQFVYSSSVAPNWIGKTDQFWYSYEDSTGTHYYLVDAEKVTKQPLFDRANLAAQLSVEVKKPLDPAQLNLQRARIDDEGKVFSFQYDRKPFEYSLESETLKAVEQDEDDEEPQTQFGRGMTREQIQEIIRRRQGSGWGGRGGQAGGRGAGSHRAFSPDRKSYVFAKGHDLYYVDVPEEMLKEGLEKARKSAEKEEADEEKANEEDEQKDDDDDQDQEDKDDTEKNDDESSQESVADSAQDETTQDEEKKESDDSKTEDGEKDKQDDSKDVEKQEEKKEEEKKKDEEDGDKDDEKEKDEQQDEEDSDSESDDDESKDDEDEGNLPIPELDESLDDQAIRLTKDGEENYTFARIQRRGGQGDSDSNRSEANEETKSRPSVSWSEDSKSFYVTRRDSRGVKQLWVINSLADPRPTLESYDYPMPGEEKIRKSELYTFYREAKKLVRAKPKWVDESYSNLSWGETGDELRFLRRDRLLRGIEYCALDLKSGEAKCLIEERFENANLSTQSIRYLDKTDEIIWWSERTGWAHFYLYDRDGKLKNPITSGQFRVSSIVAIDEDNRTLYVRGNAREEGENVYHEHLYSVRFDGTGLQLMDPGSAHHRSVLSPTRRFLVDNCSRVDMAPISVLRKANGDKVMDLESTDMSRLKEIGWQAPETFVVKAADGVTDLYGNMWKPFNFDPKKKYPIIAHVYPGPQTEGTRHDFTAVAGEQQLAQIGFIVIQVGHRGGAPTRSKAYGAYGYNNLRDYGLADKKAAIEQLAQRFPYVDIERVGLYGHSGGGFMTAAAMLREPYNDFFKVGVSTAGNHDNNIYNNSWSERYHGLKEVVEEVAEERGGARGGRGSRGGFGGRGGQQRSGQQRTEQRRGAEGDAEDAAFDYFQEYEIRNDEDGESLDRWNQQAWWDEDAANSPNSLQQEVQEEERGGQQTQRRSRGGRGGRQRTEQGRQDGEQQDDQQDGEEKKEQDSDSTKSDEEKQQEEVTEEKKQEEQGKEEEQKEEEKDEDDEEESDQVTRKTRFEINVPTNAELAGNLKGHLFLIHGELDNNVHPANTLRLVDALIKANKRFDMLYLPATRHGFGSYQPYVNQRMYEYFAEHLLNDYQEGADIGEKDVFGGVRQ